MPIPVNSEHDSAQRVVIIGQGYVGLPIAMRASEVGYNVVGIDLNDERVASLNSGKSFVEDISDSEITKAIAQHRYVATTNYSYAEGFSYAVIAVPTPLKESLPDLSFIEDAANSIGPYLTHGSTVILESTTYPGTTQELLVPILESASGLAAGVDFFVGYSPERIDPGNPEWGFVNTPKIISGINDASLAEVDRFYSTLVDRTVPVSSPREAELAKLLENTFRHVNIALVNELAVFARQLGANVSEAINAAASKPFGFMSFRPGPGVGGHCLPVDPVYLSWEVHRKLGRNFRFIELAGAVNDYMPNYVVQRAIEELSDRGKALSQSRILLLGVAYKKNSGDIRESPSLRIHRLLTDYHASVFSADPHVTDTNWPKDFLRVSPDVFEYEPFDLIILVTDHDAYDYSALERTTTPILDTQNRLPPSCAISLF